MKKDQLKAFPPKGGLVPAVGAVGHPSKAKADTKAKADSKVKKGRAVKDSPIE